jgi:hypothetical protein
VGHPDARLEDITLRFTGPDGRPCDSVLWLRNGGGKSSILNLVFSVLRTSRREFLGTGAEARVRHLEDYVGPSDVATVALEWELDALPDAEPTRVITAATLEHRRSGEGAELRRLFHALRVDPHPDLRFSLEDLPLVIQEAGRRRLLRTNAVRDQLLAISDTSPALRYSHTEVLHEWDRILESFQLDPQVFGYQLRMNHREGAADDLFRFASSEEFADFLQEMVLRAEDAEPVSQNLREFRTKLELRPRLEEERNALLRANDTLVPLQRLAEERARLHELLLATVDQLSLWRARLDVTRKEREARTSEVKERHAEADARYRAASEARNKHGWTLRVFLMLAARHAVEEATREVDAAASELGRLERREELLRCAASLADLRKAEARAEELAQELKARLEEHRPIHREFQEAAHSLVQALDVRLAGLGSHAAQLTQQEKGLLAREQTVKARQKGLLRSVGELTSKEKSLGERLQGLEHWRKELESRGMLLPGERPTSAQARHETTRKELRHATQQAEASREKAEADAQQAQAALSAAERRALAATTQANSAEQELSRARAQLERLRANPMLQEALEDPQPDLLALGLEALRRAGVLLQKLEDALILARLEEQGESRILRHLEQHELLPPSPDAERVQELLCRSGLTAFTGGMHLAANARGDRADARVRARPELVAGVVVEAKELERAAAVLASHPPELESPVAVGSTAALLEGGTPSVVVLPSRAFYDQSRATEERLRRQEQASRRREHIESLGKRSRGLQEAKASLELFVQQHPPAWFADMQARLDRQRIEARTAEKEAATFKQRQSEALLLAAKAREAIRAYQGQLTTNQEALSTLDAFMRSGGGELDSLLSELSRLRDELRRLEEAERESALELETLDERKRTQQEQLMRLELDRRLVEQERAGVAGDTSEEVPGPPLSLEVARERYRQRKEAFEQKVGRSELAVRLKAQHELIRDFRGKLETLLRSTRYQRPEVEQTLDEALQEAGLEQVQARVQAALKQSRRTHTEACADEKVRKEKLKGAENDVEEIRLQGKARYVEEVLRGAESLAPAALTAREAEERASMTSAQAEETASKALREEAEAQLTRLGVEVPRLQAWCQRLEDARNIVPQEPEVMRLLALAREESPLATLDSVAQEVDTVIDAVRRDSQALHRCEAEVEVAARRLASFALAPEQAALPPKLRERLADPAIDVLLQRAPDYLQELKVRIATVEDSLAEVNRHRGLLADSLQRAADPAFDLLRRLERSSIFPREVAVWGSSPFLKVSLRIPGTAEERRAVALQLVDTVVAQREVPSGLKLVQRLVRELTRGGGLTVMLLKPEAHRRLHYEPIEQLRAFSRGEQLTAAILLYCTLARLRAMERGRSRTPTSVLILDNPLGTCSNPELVQLQLAMAAAHGVQLIYTTGIEDLEALGQLTNIVRLRNAHQDVRGQRHVTAEPLEATRIAIRGQA